MWLTASELRFLLHQVNSRIDNFRNHQIVLSLSMASTPFNHALDIVHFLLSAIYL
ncbi:hypothetical protein SAMN05660226_00554 [Parapedobacter luteus]|uniref:Uncharacterized protein n=1 Tax=Parapedobacter luteus TaxID=623280 RepID=A0A1T5A4I3_9SPHI|nr:hypothetical protein SAMN05660226_00554 [Parapedobacter luteus]